jgi:hypothetical protein
MTSCLEIRPDVGQRRKLFAVCAKFVKIDDRRNWPFI